MQKLTLVSIYCNGRRVSVFMMAEVDRTGTARISEKQKREIMIAAGAGNGTTYAMGM